MRALLLASGFAVLGVGDVMWLDLRLVPAVIGHAVPQQPAQPQLQLQTQHALPPMDIAPPAPRESTPPSPPAAAVAPVRDDVDANQDAAPPPLRIHFAVDAWTPLASAKHDEHAAIARLSEDPTLVVMIDGHTDQTGESAHNDALSRARADYVAASLVANGVSRRRILVTAHGEREPVARGEDATSLARNRRVELRFQRRRTP